MNPLVGTGALIRLTLRRDRLVLPVWVAAAALVPYGVASGAAGLYTTPDALRRYAAAAMGSQAQVAMRGLVYAPTLGGVTVWGRGLDLPVAGSFVLGLSGAGVGIASGALTAVAAQLTTSSGFARGTAFGGLALLFVLRAVGDSQGSGLSWLSPFGWGRLTRAYTGDRWWVFALFAGFAAVAVGAAYLLSARRDLAAGFVRDVG